MTSRSTFEVLWTEVAAADLEDVVGFIEQEDPGAARAILDRLEQTAQKLEQHPYRGRVVPELARFELRLYRELIVRPWRIIYRVGQRRSPRDGGPGRPERSGESPALAPAPSVVR